MPWTAFEEGRAMKSRVAVHVEHGKPLVVEDVQFPAPGPDQVLVRQFASGVCHSQLHQLHNAASPRPLVLGHESTGVVEAAGSEVSHVREGDRVMVTWVPRSPEKGFRPSAAVLDFRGQEARSTNVFTWGEHTLVHHQYVVPLDKDMPTDVTAIIGCAVLTGVGAAQNTANVQAGQSVAVFGAGGVGLCVIAGAAARRASPIIAIDLTEDKLEFARKFGATHTVNARETDAVQAVIDLTGGGADFAFDAIGHRVTMEQILPAVRAGQLGRDTGGTAVLVGVPQEDMTLNARMLLVGEKKYIGSIGGSSRPDQDFPRYLRMYREGELDLDALVTRRFTLDQINDAVGALERGEIAGRAILEFSK
jgi:Zn-dependent alcohol dehydrogenase